MKLLSANRLKLIAIVCMFIDHFAIVFLLGYFNELGINPFSLGISKGFTDYGSHYATYMICRGIGRMAFPLFAFLLTEGLSHTKNIKRYLLRLLAFSVISEIPFDLVAGGKVFYPESQNVFFTLFLGLLAIWLIDRVRYSSFVEDRLSRIPRLSSAFKRYALTVIIAALFTAVSFLLKTDYPGYGILVIISFYFFREYGNVTAAIICCALLSAVSRIELSAFLCVPLIAMYNSKKGRGNKFFFYSFYPLHLLLLWGVKQLL